MSSFDVTLNPMGLNLMSPSAEEVENGAPPLIQILVPLGIALPIDAGNGQALAVPIGQVRFPVPRDLAIDFGKKIIEEAEKLPEPKPQIEIAGGINDAALQAAADADRRFRGIQ